MKIAIIGTGISGLTCAYLLKQQHDLTVYEANDYIGGHTHTVDVELQGKPYAVDTGFIVFNEWTYPNFLKLLAQLGLQKQPSKMSFSVKNTAAGLEYCGSNLNTLFAQRSNLLKPSFYQLVKEILCFNRLCKRVLAKGENCDTVKLGEFLAQHQFSQAFKYNYILPMGAAIWSSSLEDFFNFPLGFFLRFFQNHGLFNLIKRPQWYVIPNGSRSYIAPMLAGITERVRLQTPVVSIERAANQVTLVDKQGHRESFEQVIFACHSDQALAILGAQATPQEHEILGAIPYQYNQAILHTDTTVMPQQRLAWASWNYLITGTPDEQQRPATVTYNMNTLQSLTAPATFLVTLNNPAAIAEEQIIASFAYHHPSYTLAGMQARQRRAEICGVERSHFCGAYWYNGFHEDGVRSALDVTRRFQADL